MIETLMEFLADAGGNTEWSMAYWRWLAAGGECYEQNK